eukprot:scaffold11504_cov125-Skeletonema_dohrnii-CCMP3373.AAC.1
MSMDPNNTTNLPDSDATKRVFGKRRQLERRIAELEAINAALREKLPSKNEHIAMLEERICNMSFVSVKMERRIAKLEAINAALRKELPSKNAHIAMLEERITNMSVDLASSRAREDEQCLMLRRSSQGSTMSDCDGNIPSAEPIDDSIKSALSPAQISSSSSSSSYRQFQRRFSLPIPSWVSNSTTQDDINDSTRSLTNIGGIMGNMIKLDKSDKSQNLRVDFPAGGRQMFRLRMSDLTADYSPEDETFEQEEEQDHEEGQQQQASPQRQRRRPSRSTLTNGQHHTNSRLISSTVVFPKEDDNDSFGFK